MLYTNTLDYQATMGLYQRSPLFIKLETCVQLILMQTLLIHSTIDPVRANHKQTMGVQQCNPLFTLSSNKLETFQINCFIQTL